MTTPDATSSHRRSNPSGALRRLLDIVLVASCVFALGVLGILPAQATASPASRAAAPVSASAAQADGVRLALVSTSPAPTQPGSGLKVSVRVTNTTAAKISGRKATLEVGTNALDSLGAQQRWSEGTASPAGALSATTNLPDLAAGATTTVQLDLPASTLSLRYTMATLPVRVTVGEAQLRTSVTWVGSSATFDTPVSASLVIPVTLPDDPALLTASGTARFEAWQKAIGPGSAIDKLLSSNPGAPVTWLIDPAVLDPAEAQDGRLPRPTTATQDDEPSSSSSPSSSSTSSPTSSAGASSSSSSASASSSSGSSPASSSTSSGNTATAGTTPTGSGTSSPSVTGSTSPGTSSSSGSASDEPSDSTSSSTAPTSPTTVEDLAARLRSKLASRPDSQQILFTPYGDPDLSSLTSASRPAGSEAVLARALARPLSAEVQKLSTQMVAAPVSPLDSASTGRLVAAWKKARGGATPTILTSSISLDGSSLAVISSAARRTTDGVPMLGYDSHLSRLLSDTTSLDATDDAASAASLQAASLASYQQAPTTSRSALLMGSRETTMSPSRLSAVIAALQSAPWINPVSLDLSAPARAAADVTLAREAPSSEDVWPRPGATAFDAADLTTAGRTLGTLTDMAEMVDDGDDIVPAWTRNLDQATSTRWRDHPAQVDALVQHARTTVDAIPLKVSVVPSRVNFFADSGVITVTIKNELARRVRDVSLTLTPRSYGVTFRDQPRPVDIAAGSQTSVRVGAAAHTSGRVPVETRLTSATGIVLGGTDDGSSDLEINARPTGTWIFWVLGIVALLVFCYGLVRYRQKGTRRRDELAQEIQ